MFEKIIAFFVCGAMAVGITLIMGVSGTQSVVSGLVAGTIAVQLLKYLNGDFNSKAQGGSDHE